MSLGVCAIGVSDATWIIASLPLKRTGLFVFGSRNSIGLTLKITIGVGKWCVVKVFIERHPFYYTKDWSL